MSDFTIKSGSANYSRPNKSAIDCQVTISGIGEVPFTATANDSELRGQEIWAALTSGVAGPISAYEAPTIILTRLPKLILVNRLTTEEADMFKADLADAPGQLDLLWNATEVIDSTHEHYPTLRAVIRNRLSEERTNEILAPTE